MAEENVSETTPVTLLDPNQSGLVDLDLYKMRGDGFEDSEIAKFVLGQYKPKGADGNYYSLDESYYEALKKGMAEADSPFGTPVEPMSDREIIAMYSTARDVPQPQYIAEQAVKGLIPSAATMGGAYAGSPFGIPGILTGGILSMISSDLAMRQVNPEMYEQIVGDTTGGEAVRFFTESVPGLAVPWMVPEKAMINLGSDFISKNAARIPFGTKISSGLEKGEGYVREAFDFARQNPRTYLGTETKDILTASGVAAGFEAYQQGDRGALSDLAQFGTEIGVTVAQPLDVLGRLMVNNTGAFGTFLKNINQKSRVEYSGNRFIELLRAGGEDPEVFLRLIQDINSGRRTPETELLRSAGLDYDNATAALKTGVPVLFLLESVGLENKLKNGSPIRNPDVSIREQHEAAFQGYNNFLNKLLEIDDPAALGLYQDLRDAGFRTEINNLLTSSMKNYDRAAEKALAGGETFDSEGVLFDTLFGPNGVSAKIDAQANVLKNLIPKNINVPNTALQGPLNNGKPTANLLVDMFNRLGDEAAILGNRPRLSYGKDLISLDKVLREMDILVNPEKAKKAGDLPKLPEQQLELDLPTVSAPAEAAEEFVQDITSGDLLNFLDQIDQSKRQALRAGNQPLLKLLAQLEEGAKNSLRAVSANRNVETPGGGFSQFFDNYLAFRDEANNVFSNAFLQDMRSQIPKELSGQMLFSNMGDSTLLRMQEMDSAATFILDYDQRNAGVLSNANEMGAARGEFSGEDGIIDDGGLEGLLESGLPVNEAIRDVETPTIVPTIRSAQDKVLRGLLENPKYFNRTPVKDADGRIIMIEDPENPDLIIPKTNMVPTQAFQNFIADPQIDRVLSNYFPSLRGDLKDVNRFNALLENATLEESLFNKGLTERDAFSNYFSGIYEQPQAALKRMIGDPGTSRSNVVGNPIKDFTEAAKIAVDSGDENVIQGFLDTIFQQAYTYAGGNSPIDKDTGTIPFDLEKFKQYLNDPMLPNKGADSVIQILAKTGLLEEGNSHVAKINRLIDVMNQIQLTNNAARLPELNELIAARRQASGLDPNLSAEEIVNQDPANAIRATLEQGAFSIVGAGIGSSVYSLITKILPGNVTQGGLSAAGTGSRLSRMLLSEQPGMLANQMMTEMLKDTELLEEVLTLAMKGDTVADLSGPKLKRMYTFLLGGGIINPEVSYRMFAEEVYGKKPSEQRQAEREEAGAVPIVPQRPNPRRVQPSIVPPPEPVTPPPQAAAPRPMPPPVAQAPAPTAQAPASPDQRARYAAMFPNDTASGLIRQGIGSLS